MRFWKRQSSIDVDVPFFNSYCDLFMTLLELLLLIALILFQLWVCRVMTKRRPTRVERRQSLLSDHSSDDEAFNEYKRGGNITIFYL